MLTLYMYFLMNCYVICSFESVKFSNTWLYHLQFHFYLFHQISLHLTSSNVKYVYKLYNYFINVSSVSFLSETLASGLRLVNNQANGCLWSVMQAPCPRMWRPDQAVRWEFFSTALSFSWDVPHWSWSLQPCLLLMWVLGTLTQVLTLAKQELTH